MGISALLASQILDASATGRSVLTGADASAIRSTLGLGTLATQSPTGTPSASTFLRGDYSWQTIDLSGYLPLAGGTMTGQLTITQGTANTSVLTSTGYSLTGSNAQSLMDLSGTWNTTGNPTLIKANVTVTNFGSSSKIFDYIINGTSRLSCDVGGSLTLQTGGIGNQTQDTLIFGSGHRFLVSNSTRFQILSSAIAIGSLSTNVRLSEDASDTLAQRNSTNAQTFRLYGTYTDASNYRRLFLSSTTAGAFTLGVEGAGTGASGNTLTLGNPVSVTGGTITASTPALNVTQTWNNAATTFTGILANVTDTASNANSLLMDLQVGGSSKFQVGKSGAITVPSNTFTPAYGGAGLLITTDTLPIVYLRGGSNRGLEFNSASHLAWTNSPGSAAPDLAILRDAANTLAQRNSTNAQTFRVYNTYTDASNYERGKIEWSSNVLRIGTEKAGTGSARALELQTDGTTRLTIGTTGLFTIADALNIAVGTTTGTKIGTATAQKLGFFNATPVVQPTAVADATDAASVITQLNALLSRMRDLGLIAT